MFLIRATPFIDTRIHLYYFLCQNFCRCSLEVILTSSDRNRTNYSFSQMYNKCWDHIQLFSLLVLKYIKCKGCKSGSSLKLRFSTIYFYDCKMDRQKFLQEKNGQSRYKMNQNICINTST